MNEAELLTDAFDRIKQSVRGVVADLSDDQLAHRVDGRANSIAWLVWHLTRIQDDHVADVAGHDQVWLADGWQQRFGLPLEPRDHGYGHTSEQVAAVRASAALLSGYHVAVHERTVTYLATLTGAHLDRVVDERWDPPVTLGVRLVSVVT